MYEVPKNVEATPEYMDGAVSYVLDQKDTEACPYEQGDQRTRWMCGYFGERVRQFLLRFETKYHLAR